MATFSGSEVNKEVLIFAWEYYGYHSRQGTALSKRPTQVADSFRKHGWSVTYIHRDAIGECGNKDFVMRNEANGTLRIAVKMKRSYTDEHISTIWRKVSTIYYVACKGDRSSRWAEDVKANFELYDLNRPNLIISFYTPRAPLLLGKYFSKKLNVPWVADLQDPISDGINSNMKTLAASWMKRTLKSAAQVFHISPQSAKADGELINRIIFTLWHAVPAQDFNMKSYVDPELLSAYNGCFNVFYAGSINESIQTLAPMKEVIENLSKEGVKTIIHLAGSETADHIFVKHLGRDAVHFIGWIGNDALRKYVINCHCTLVIPAGNKKVVPSKLFEFLGYNKPVWIIGKDSGTTDTLLTSWGINFYPISDIKYQTAAALKTFHGDPTGLLLLENCPIQPLMAEDLFQHYAAFAT